MYYKIKIIEQFTEEELINLLKISKEALLEDDQTDLLSELDLTNEYKDDLFDKINNVLQDRR
jgi:hypothetical protein